MQHIRDNPQTRRTAAILLLLWLALLPLTAFTWIFEPTGEPVGINPVASLLYLITPMAIAIWVGWRQATPRAGLKKGLVTGALVAAANMAGLLLWSAAVVAQGRVTTEAAGMSGWEMLFEALSMGLFYVAIGAVAGSVGGLLGAWLGAARR